MVKTERYLIDSVEPGMVIAEPVSSGTMILLDKGVSLTPELIARLKKRGISSVVIQVKEEDMVVLSSKEEDISPEKLALIESRITKDVADLKKTSHSFKDDAQIKIASGIIDRLIPHIERREVLDALIFSLKIPDDEIKVKLISSLDKAQDNSKVISSLVIAMRLYSLPVKTAALNVIASLKDPCVVPMLVPTMKTNPAAINTLIMEFFRQLPQEPVLSETDKLIKSTDRSDISLGLQLLSLFKDQEEIDQLKKSLLGLKKKDKLFEKAVKVESAKEAFAGEMAPTPDIDNSDAIMDYEPPQDTENPENIIKLEFKDYKQEPVEKSQRHAHYSKQYEESARTTAEMMGNIRKGIRVDEQTITQMGARIVNQVLEDPLCAFKLTATTTRDNYLLAHSLNTAYISVLIGKLANLEDNSLLELSIASLLHDVGMVKVKNLVWNDGKKIDDLEYFDVQKHTIYGIDALSGMRFSKNIAYVAYQHHERVDGKGYPKGRSSRIISTFAKIVGLSDVYVALTSPRPHRPAHEPLEAIRIMVKDCKGWFDPDYFRLFRDFLAKNLDEDIGSLDPDKDDGAKEGEGISANQHLSRSASGGNTQDLLSTYARNTTALGAVAQNLSAADGPSDNVGFARSGIVGESGINPVFSREISSDFVDSDRKKESAQASIFIIDDESSIIKVIQKVLESSLPVIVEGCVDGRKGLNRLTQQKYDLLLLDIMMPEMDGITLLRAMRRSPVMKDMTVLFLSAKRDREAIEWALKLGVVDFIVKPFDSDSLNEKIKRLLIKKGLLAQMI